MAGVSVDYYTRLEQGRERNPSASVLESLASTLLLDSDERKHLFRLAHGGDAGQSSTAGALSRKVRPGVRQLLDTVGSSPAYVLSSAHDVLAANIAGTALLWGLAQWPASRQNTIRYIFLHPTARTLFTDWNTIAQSSVAHLRVMAGLHSGDSELACLISELRTKSEEFQKMWCQHDVRSLSTGRKHFDHPKVGRMELSYEVLCVSDTSQRLVVYQARPGTTDHDAMLLLNIIGSQESKAAALMTPHSHQR